MSVLSPQQAIQRVIDEVNALVGTGPHRITPGEANSLTSGKLEQAIHQLDKSKPDLKKAIQHLQMFVDRAATLPEPPRLRLIAEINDIIRALLQ